MSIFSFISDFFEFRRQRTFRYQFSQLLKQLANRDIPPNSITLTYLGSENLDGHYSLNTFPRHDGKSSDLVIVDDENNMLVAEELFGFNKTETAVSNCSVIDIPAFIERWKEELDLPKAPPFCRYVPIAENIEHIDNARENAGGNNMCVRYQNIVSQASPTRSLPAYYHGRYAMSFIGRLPEQPTMPGQTIDIWVVDMGRYYVVSLLTNLTRVEEISDYLGGYTIHKEPRADGSLIASYTSELSASLIHDTHAILIKAINTGSVVLHPAELTFIKNK